MKVRPCYLLIKLYIVNGWEQTILFSGAVLRFANRCPKISLKINYYLLKKLLSFNFCMYMGICILFYICKVKFCPCILIMGEVLLNQ